MDVRVRGGLRVPWRDPSRGATRAGPIFPLVLARPFSSDVPGGLCGKDRARVVEDRLRRRSLAARIPPLMPFTRPGLIRSPPKIGPSSTKAGQPCHILAKPGPSLAKSGPKLNEFGKIWPRFNLGPSSADVGQSSSKSEENAASVHKLWPHNSVTIVPPKCQSWPNSVNRKPTIRPNGDRPWPDLVKRGQVGHGHESNARAAYGPMHGTCRRRNDYERGAANIQRDIALP